ncbi:MAG TPA: chromosome partitioning protein ParB [Gammaproteobacteria bacterium]|uniref:ParB/RepB/Spo0J family partition protein n=1 Tax=Immundisolibacter sp. TaxID=1934948 RepID=UPI000E99A628|nr:chromosome partitioning protein ParB [Gammaproteobacteria bacterium]HCZ49554.1 chromosome partitioning protein ParB [Gammaproteobacteria bacterium]MCH78992.1 chromosome partitioning protein ParB [Gammaproteobacteria bacterium]
MTQKRGLGRGLEALLSSTPSASGQERLTRLPIEHIERGRYQPRRHIGEEELASLADSIRAQGVVQPVVVRRVGDNRYELIAGERRWRASQLAGLHELPAIVRDVPDEDAAAVALIENIQRQDLNAMEEADALERLMREFGLTHEQVARAVGRSRTAVSNLLRLRQLTPAVRELVERRQLDMGHARALLAVTGADQVELARRVVANGLSVRQTEQLVARHLRGETPPAPRAPDPDVRQLEQRLADQLGARVAIEHGRRGGRLVIRYNSLDELDGILAHIR